MTTTPPPGPPSPPAGPPPGTLEYLELGRGARVTPDAAAPSVTTRRRWRRGLLVGGGALGLVAAAAGAWAVVSFFSTGPQPAQALPSTTLAYLSVDLDPSGGQKIEALRTLDKFPAFKEHVGITSHDDVRERLFEQLQKQGTCGDLDWGKDVAPWLGQRAAIAAVDTGADDPEAVLVLQVTDAAAADRGLTAVRACSGSDATSGGWDIHDGWAVIASSERVARQVSDATAKGSLADDADFKRWTDQAGSAGIVTAYAAPRLGSYLADHAGSLFGFFGGGPPSNLVTSSISAPVAYHSGLALAAQPSPVSDSLKRRLRDFTGAAMVIRFAGGAVELETAGDADLLGNGIFGGGAGGEAISGLPDETAVAFGAGFEKGWLAGYVDEIAGLTGQSSDDLLAQLSDETGLDLPADIETLTGRSAAVGIGAGIRRSQLESDDLSGAPIVLKVKGDPAAIEAVLDKVRAKLPSRARDAFTSDSAGDVVVIGPDSDYREQALHDGHLGDTDTFRDVVREADHANAVLFVDVDRLDQVIVDAVGEDGDRSVIENIKPIAGFGISAWTDGGVSHAVMRLTTD